MPEPVVVCPSSGAVVVVCPLVESVVSAPVTRVGSVVLTDVEGSVADVVSPVDVLVLVVEMFSGGVVAMVVSLVFAVEVPVSSVTVVVSGGE